MSDKKEHIEIVSLPAYAQADSNFVASSICELKESFFATNGKPHRHDFYTIYWIKKGHIEPTIDAVTYEVNQNTLYFLAPGQVHTMTFSEKVEGYMIAFQDAFMCLKDQAASLMGINSSLFFNNQFSTVITLQPEQERDFEMLVQLMKKEVKDQEPGFDTALHGLLRYFLVLASRIKGSSMIATPDQHASHNSSLFLQFKNLIEDKYTTHKNVSDYASLMHVKPVLLNEISKQQSGITAGEHIRNRVILEAQRYLYNTDLSAKEIAYRLGFEDPHYFSRFFKKYTGQTPSEFKETGKLAI